MKRMIDNKEFNKIKQDIVNINEEIVKNKGIPTITIEASQMSGATFQLTDEQFEILSNYPVVYIVLDDGRTATYYKETLALQSENIINFITFTNDTTQDDKIETYASIIIIDKTDKTAIYSSDKVGGGKQLYQHNILLSHDNSNYRIFVSIINDSATPMTEDGLISYLNDRNYYVKATGSFYDSGSYIVWGLYKKSDTQYQICYQRISDGTISVSWAVNKGFFTFTDNVETL